MITGIGNGDTKSQSSDSREEIQGKDHLKKQPLVVPGGRNPEHRLRGTHRIR